MENGVSKSLTNGNNMAFTEEQIKENLKALERVYRTKSLEGIQFSTDEGKTWTLEHRIGPIFLYRIKPEPKLRPWRPEEVPVGAFFKLKLSSPNCWIRIPLLVNSEGIWFFHTAETKPLNYVFDEIMREYLYTVDGGKTWLPCGVQEEE